MERRTDRESTERKRLREAVGGLTEHANSEREVARVLAADRKTGRQAERERLTEGEKEK